jgi:cytochrome o ubiquinol oxidase subunit III
MNVAVAAEIRHLGHAAEAAHTPKEIIAGYGFWIFLLSDFVTFATLFAAYAVLVDATAGGPAGHELFSQTIVAIETACLLASSYTCGLMSLAAGEGRQRAFYIAAVVTFALGAAFLALELYEFAHLIAQDATPQRSAFLSAFYALVGCHGLHVAVGLVWLAVMMGQGAIKDFRPSVMRRLQCFSLFWHALDIVWVAIFSVVYLMGVTP